MTAVHDGLDLQIKSKRSSRSTIMEVGHKQASLA